MPLDPELLFQALIEQGIRDFAGVPCSILNHLIREAEASPRVDYLAASIEGEAVAAAAGAWLGGSLGAVLMQNSGLGNAVNPLSSLAVPYEIPLLMIVSWRGEPGRKDAVHHFPMGAATAGVFGLFGVPAQVLREDTDLAAAAAVAVGHMRSKRTPAALIVPRGVFAGSSKPAPRPAPVLAAPRRAPAAVRQFGAGPIASRAEVLEAWLDQFPEALAIGTTGFMSRELAAKGRPDRHFPMQGSMGYAPAIALGLARSQPEREVCVLDGDGALLMHMGSLATIGSLQPRRFVHVVVDNGTYASTGGQLSVSPGVDFAGVALACGYRRAARCNGRDGLAAALAWAREGLGEGPCLLHVVVDEAESPELDRPEMTPPEIATAFRAAVTGPAS